MSRLQRSTLICRRERSSDLCVTNCMRHHAVFRNNWEDRRQGGVLHYHRTLALLRPDGNSDSDRYIFEHHAESRAGAGPESKCGLERDRAARCRARSLKAWASRRRCDPRQAQDRGSQIGPEITGNRSRRNGQRLGEAGTGAEDPACLHCGRSQFYFNDASILVLYSRAFARIAGSSSVNSFLSRITVRPPMITVSTSLPFNAYANCEYASYIGTAFGPSSPITMMSAFLPVSSEPISLSMCSARAPSMVAISTTALAPSARGSIFVTFCSFAARSISSIKFRSLLLPAGPSVPRPTAMPAARSSITGATPLASIMLLEGLCTHPTWRCARILRSASSTQMQCAATTSGPRIPSLSRYCTGVVPFFSRLSPNSFFVSAT